MESRGGRSIVVNKVLDRAYWGTLVVATTRAGGVVDVVRTVGRKVQGFFTASSARTLGNEF